MKAAFKNAFCLSSMFFDFNFLDVFVYEYPSPVAPHKGYHHQQCQLFNPIDFVQVGFLYIEPAGFHCFEKIMESSP